jgi:hypothetical protein
MRSFKTYLNQNTRPEESKSCTQSQNSSNKNFTQKTHKTHKFLYQSFQDENFSFTLSQKPKIKLIINKAIEYSYLSPNKEILLLTKIKLSTGEKTIEIHKSDNIYTKAFNFCYQNNLNYNFILPIYSQIISALKQINDVLNSEIDSDLLENINQECKKE